VKNDPDNKKLRYKLYQIIFEADTKNGKRFDIALLFVILASILLVIMESVHAINDDYGKWLKMGEWLVTIIFTFEYILRIYVIKKPLSYIFSFYGLVDLLSVLPTYLSLFLTGAGGLMVIRALRLLRVFRILKLSRYTKEASYIMYALRESRHKLGVFLMAILTIVTILGTIMYLVEGEEHGFSSIPESIYWAIVTLTTVGYGDIAPQTNLGKFISSFVMILGYAIIAVPTGIITVALNNKMNKSVSTRVCPECLSEEHETDAQFCKKCGAKLDQEPNI
jgi:voltage-gated potassium channel